MRGNVRHSSYISGDGGRAVGSGRVWLGGREGLVGLMGGTTTFLIYGLGWWGCIPLRCGAISISRAIPVDIPLG